MMNGHQPISRQRSTWVESDRRDIADLFVEQGALDARTFSRRVGDGVLRAFVSIEPAGWHASVSFTNHKGDNTRYPTWDELADARYALLPDDLDFVMHLPPSSEYVAVHATTFHLHQHPELEP